MVGIVKDHEGFLDCSDQLGLVLKQVRIQNCKAKIFKKVDICLLLLNGVLEVRVVEVHEGVLGGSYQK